MNNIPELDNCPACNSSWVGEPIPEASRQNYGGKTHFRRVIGIEFPCDHPEHYDGVSVWACPDCKAQWNRFTGHRRYIPEVGHE